MPRDADSRADYVTIGGKPYLTYPRGLAKELARSDRTIRRMTARREGPPIIEVGNTKLVDPDDLPEWLSSLKRSSRQAFLSEGVVGRGLPDAPPL